MVELTHNGKRYMVDKGQWFRRLEAGDRITTDTQYKADVWGPSFFREGHLVREATDCYRVPCSDPRPAFEEGQRVKVARKDESWAGWNHGGDFHLGKTYSVDAISPGGNVRFKTGLLTGYEFPPWCLDPVEEQQPPQPKPSGNVFEFVIDGQPYRLLCQEDMQPLWGELWSSCPVPQAIQDAINERLGKPTGETE